MSNEGGGDNAASNSNESVEPDDTAVESNDVASSEPRSAQGDGEGVADDETSEESSTDSTAGDDKVSEALETAAPKHRAGPNKTKRVLMLGIPLLLLTMVLAALVGYLSVQASNDSEAIDPLQDLGETFPVPPGSVIAFPTTVDETTPSVILGWKNEGLEIGPACDRWREAFRSWVSDADPTTVGGSVVEGRSCSFRAVKQETNVSLIVAKYGTEPPQATLTVGS